MNDSEIIYVDPINGLRRIKPRIHSAMLGSFEVRKKFYHADDRKLLSETENKVLPLLSTNVEIVDNKLKRSLLVNEKTLEKALEVDSVVNYLFERGRYRGFWERNWRQLLAFVGGGMVGFGLTQMYWIISHAS